MPPISPNILRSDMVHDIKNNNEWEEAEREADEDIRLGRVKTFNSIDELIADLQSNIKE